MTHLEKLQPRPADALLGLMTAYREDARGDKIDLGVGIYKDDTGHTPVMRAVAKAEALMLERQDTKAYEGPRGNVDFCNAIEDFVFGADSAPRAAGQTLSFMTPGGCGALFLGAGLMKRLGAKRVWVSRPTWPNHINLVNALGLETQSYDYAADGELAWDALVASLEAAQPGDGIIIQGPCHNPTGIDLNLEQWRALAALCRDKDLIPMLDVAYHGFAHGLDADMAGVRAFVETAPDVLMSYSCSKNFGLYRDRTGCFLAKGQSAEAIAAASTHVADLARTSYSMPPAHGAAIVATILGDAALRVEWEAELTMMRERMIGLRRALSDALVSRTGSNVLGKLSAQNGMFSQLPVTAEAATAMREEDGLYLPGSGRINIAGLRTEQIDRIADIVSARL